MCNDPEFNEMEKGAIRITGGTSLFMPEIATS
jgi:hypothetical protein